MRRTQLPAHTCGACGAEAVTWSRRQGVCGECGAVLAAAAYEVRLPAEPLGLTRETVSAAPIFSPCLLDNCASSDNHTRKRAARNAWLDHVELYTTPHRRRRAARHRLRAGSHWHRVREKGQGERFDRVRRCGRAERMLVGVHKLTGAETQRRPFRELCGCWRACESCLRRRKTRLAVDVDKTRTQALKARARRFAPTYRGAEGRWMERLITLTVPHGEGPGPDARVLVKAWREFSRRLMAHLRIDRGCDLTPDARPDGKKRSALVSVRALEIAPGATGGHAHMHVWWVGPYVDNVWARVTWGRVLEQLGVTCPQRDWNAVMHLPPRGGCEAKDAYYGRKDDDDSNPGLRDQRVRTWCRTRRGKLGAEVATLPWPHVDLRVARDEGGAAYATKVGVHFYVTKGSDTARLNPIHAASVYEALEGARAVQWGMGWAPEREPSEFEWRRVPMTDAERREWCAASWGDAGCKAVESAEEPSPPAPVHDPPRQAYEQMELGEWAF